MDRGDQHNDADAEKSGHRRRLAERGAGRPPECAADIRRELHQHRRLQHSHPGHRPERADRGELYGDSECRPDHRRDDLSDGPCAPGADPAEQRDGEHDRNRDRVHRQRHDDRIRPEPVHSAAPDQHVDEWSAQHQRHEHDRHDHRHDARGEQP